MKKKENETNACDAFVEILRRIKGVEYCPERWPEKENRNSPDIEVILVPKDKKGQLPKIAVEHTIVEAHKEQLVYVNQLCGIEKELKQRCQGRLPNEYCFSLIAPPSLIVGLNKKTREQFVEEMKDWIPEVSKSLTIDKSCSRLYDKHEVSLWCVGSCQELNGTVGMTSTRPKEANRERQDRFRRAVEEKLPKLVKYKEKGFSTALLLEDVSFSHALPKDDWKDLIPHQYHSEFQLKIDYFVIFVSNEKRMIVGNVWKEEAQIYAEIPDNRRFSFLH